MLLIVLFAFLLIYFDIIKTINLRVVYIPFIFIGLMLFTKDFAKVHKDDIPFRTAFVNCFRTGVYTCILLFPVFLTVLIIGLPELNMLDEFGRFDEEKFQMVFLISILVEIFASVSITSFVSAFIPGMIKKKN